MYKCIVFHSQWAWFRLINGLIISGQSYVWRKKLAGRRTGGCTVIPGQTGRFWRAGTIARVPGPSRAGTARGYVGRAWHAALLGPCLGCYAWHACQPGTARPVTGRHGHDPARHGTREPSNSPARHAGARERGRDSFDASIEGAGGLGGAGQRGFRRFSGI